MKQTKGNISIHKMRINPKVLTENQNTPGAKPEGIIVLD